MASKSGSVRWETSEGVRRTFKQHRRKRESIELRTKSKSKCVTSFDASEHANIEALRNSGA